MAHLNDIDQIEWNRALIDASFAKAPREERIPARKSGSKCHVLTDPQGIPFAATVTTANVNEVAQVLQVLNDLEPVEGNPVPT